jgi:hypothetical protein
VPRRCAILVACAIVIAAHRPLAQADALFSFHSNPWVTLHHILWSKGEGATLPTAMPDDERDAWLQGIAFYAPYSRRNLLFDDELIAIKEALRHADGQDLLDGVALDEGLKSTLHRLMPIYRKYWWAEHDATNREWIAAARPLLDRHGMAINQAIARVYDIARPDNPVWVDVSVRSHPNGAYETGPAGVTHVVISSVDRSYRGYGALEMLFHERSHAWAGALAQPIAEAARQNGIEVPQQLPHAVLFYTAGELTARELKAHGVQYAHYAHGPLYTILCGAGCEDKIAAHWTPHLDAKQSIAESLSALVAAFK